MTRRPPAARLPSIDGHARRAAADRGRPERRSPSRSRPPTTAARRRSPGPSTASAAGTGRQPDLDRARRHRASHEVVATATDADGHADRLRLGRQRAQADADGDGWTATLDCDEPTRPCTPGMTEYLGNGIDDDCDAASPDAPPGGLTGKVYGWGNGTFGALGTGFDVARRLHQAGRRLARQRRHPGRGHARHRRSPSWPTTPCARGAHGNGAIGDGQFVDPLHPGPARGPGGDGLLTGVTPDHRQPAARGRAPRRRQGAHLGTPDRGHARRRLDRRAPRPYPD